MNEKIKKVWDLALQVTSAGMLGCLFNNPQKLIRFINYQIICAMEIKILVKENEKAELDKFIETCKEYGMQLIREGGGKLPNFSGYYAELKGVRWQKADTGEGQSNIPAVSVVREPVVLGAVCPHFDTCQNGGKNKFCDLQTFKELDCFMGQTER